MPTSRRSRKQTIDPKYIRVVGFCRICWKRFSRTFDRSEPGPTRETVRNILVCCPKPDPIITDSFLIVD